MKNESMERMAFAITALVFSYHIIHLIVLWPSLRAEIAIHFASISINGFGSKYYLLIIPFISILTWGLIGWLGKKTEKLNYIYLTEENKDVQFDRTKKVLLIIQNSSF